MPDELSGSNLPNITIRNLIDGETYKIHTNNDCSSEVLSFSYDESTGSVQLSGVSLDAGEYRFTLRAERLMMFFLHGYKNIIYCIAN